MKNSPNQWLLIKAQDAHASTKDILLKDYSAQTERSMEQIGGPKK